ncbi:Endoribonuclease L-PSP family [Verrucomicrobiia bacterium DG1235]|nr:Endoribonuclease L-PSP family [Verrucomicrobiae bacterium DG1235]
MSELVEGLYEQLISVLNENQVQVIQEKIHGNASVLEEFTSTRTRILEAAGMDAELPFTYIEGRSLEQQEISSIQVWGVRSFEDTTLVRTDEDPVAPARVFKGDGYQLVYCPRIHGFDESNPDDKGCVTHQCETVFERTTAAMSRYGMSFKDVARTWIYSRRLLDWYGEFNRIRTNHFHKVGIYSTGKDPVFPASTGIQGRFSDEDIFLDALAVGGDSENGFKMEPVVTSSRQHQAFGYGSAFSRGMVVAHEGYKTVYISGTASINVLGDSTYIGDTEMQTLDTLMNIAAILEDHGGSLRDICMGTVYCKNRESYEAFKSTMRMLGIPPMPIVCVEADVCRHELLIEIEVVGMIKDSE